MKLVWQVLAVVAVGAAGGQAVGAVQGNPWLSLLLGGLTVVLSVVERHRRTAVVLLCVAYVPLAIGLSLRGSGGETPEEFVTFFLVLALAWGPGRGCGPPGSPRPSAGSGSPHGRGPPNATG